MTPPGSSEDAGTSLPVELAGLSISSTAPSSDEAGDGTTYERNLLRDKPFRFFDLPRELREKIYALSAGWMTIVNRKLFTDVDLFPELTCPAFCASSLLLVSRAFKQEYEAEIYRNAVITITLPMESEPQYHVLQSHIPTLLAKTRSVIVRLDPSGFDQHGYELDTQTSNVVRSHITSLLELFTSLRSLDLRLITEAWRIDECVSGGRFDTSSIFDIQLGHEYAHVVFSISFHFGRECLFSVADYSAEEDDQHSDQLREYLRCHDDNMIVYRGTKSQDASSWHGMHLDTIWAGDFDMAEALTDFEYIEESDEDSEEDSEYDEEAKREAAYEYRVAEAADSNDWFFDMEDELEDEYEDDFDYDDDD